MNKEIRQIIEVSFCWVQPAISRYHPWIDKYINSHMTMFFLHQYKEMVGYNASQYQFTIFGCIFLPMHTIAIKCQYNQISSVPKSFNPV